MQEQVSKKPLVDILSEMMGSRVVMRADEYVYLENKIVVSQSEIDEAIATQESSYLSDLSKNKIGEITQSFNSAVETITTALPHEMVSWRKQEDEARAYTADNTVVTPFIDAQVATRQLETKDELVVKIIANADAYEVAYAGLLGKYQNLSNAISVATTPNKLNLVVW